MKKIFILILLLFILIGCNKDLPKLEKPNEIFVEENIVHFSKVENASHYVLSINGRLTTITDTKYELTQPGIYTIKVKAQAKGYNDSDYTEEVYHSILGTNPNLKYVFNLKSSKDLTILDLNIPNPKISINNISNDYIVYLYNTIQIKSDYLKTLTIGKYNYILNINDVPFEIEIEIINNDNPYLMINNNYYFNPALDIIIRFDPINSILQNISGDELTNKDFKLDDNVITINKDFINNYFDEHPEYSLYVLTIQFKQDNKTHLARVWIHKN